MIDERALELLSRLFGLLRDSNRLRILFAIGKEKKTVSEIMKETSLPQTLVSFHLRPLRETGILTTKRKGPFMYYSLSEPALIDLLSSLCGLYPKEQIKEKLNVMCPPMAFMRRWMKGGS